MLKIEPSLPAWVEKYAIPGGATPNEALTNDNAFWFFLAGCCPHIFQSYAILLHPFRVSWDLKRYFDSGLPIKQKRDSFDFKKVSWRDFFSYFGKQFDFSSAYATYEELSKEFSKNNDWPPYLHYPAGGNAEYRDLEIVIEAIVSIYADQLVNYYYFLENKKHKDWQYGDVIYEGHLSEFEKLKYQDDIDDTPTAIYPLTKEWCIISDIDLPCTFIGGSNELVSKIIGNKELEIFRITPVFHKNI